MKKTFHVVSLLALLLTFAASTAWAEELELSGEGARREVYVPVEGLHTLTIPDGVTSIELKSDNNSLAMNSSLTLTAPTGKKLQVMEGELSGLFRENVGNLEGFRTDSLFVYDGSNSSAPELFKAARGTFMEMLTSSGQSMTIHYKENDSKGSWYYSLRFSLTVIVADLNTQHNIAVAGDCDIEGMGTVALPEAKVANTPVTLTVTPNEGYVLKYVTIGSEDSYGNIGYEIHESEFVMFPGNEVTFNMPAFDVSVCPEFISESDLQNRLVINTPMDRILRVEIPFGVQSFKIDGGGSDNDLSKPMVLTAPEGYLLEVEGNESYEWNGLFAYDGIVEDGYYKGANLLRGATTGRNLTLFYTSIGEQFRRTINLVLNEEHSIGVAAANEQGDVTISPVSGLAFAGDTITVTGVPNEGYVFNGIKVKEENEDGSELFEVVDGAWYNGEVKFVMPFKNVYVEPIFTEIGGDFRINIPKSDTLRVTVPEGITWLQIFDDGGITDNYSNGANGVLILTVPEGYTLVTGGEVDLYDENDSLYIYDGAGVNENVLSKVAEWAQFYNENEIYSTGRSLTYCLKSNTEENSDGLEMYASVMKTSNFGAVAVYEYSEDGDVYKYARIDGNYTGNDTVNISEPIEVDWIEYARKFIPGVPSTIVLPFDYNAKDIQGLEQVLEFAGVGVQDGKKVVEMRWVWCSEDVDEECSSLKGDLEANKPYVLKTKDEYIYFNGDEPVTLKKTSEAVTMVGNWQFRGTYEFKTWLDGNPELGSIYGFAGSNDEDIEVGTFVKAGAGAGIQPLRAYLARVPSKQSRVAFGARAKLQENDSDLPETMDVVIVKFKDEKPVVIGKINTVTGEFKMDRSYDIKGRKLNSKPKVRGAFYGKKELIK